MTRLHRALAAFALLPLFALAACGKSEPPAEDTDTAVAAAEAEPPREAAAQATLSSDEASAALNELMEAYNERFLELNPFMATMRGDNRYNDVWVDNFSDQYRAESREMLLAGLEGLKKIDPETLGHQDRLSYAVFETSLRQQIEAWDDGYQDMGNMLPVSQFFSLPSLFAAVGSGRQIQPFATVEDYDNWLVRSAGFALWTDKAIEHMREGMEKGVVQPRIIMEKALPQVAAHAVDDVEKSIFMMPIANMPESFPAEDRDRLTAAYREHVGEVLVPAYRRLHDFLRDEYMPATRDTVGLKHIPGGAEYYAWLAKTTTTTDLTPDEIHAIGMKEARRAFAEMNRVKDEVGFEGDMQAFFEFLRTDPQFFFDKPEDLIAGYEELRNRINPELDRLFGAQPEGDYVLREIEAFRAPASAAAQYTPGTPDGSRPGVFYVNTYDLASRPKYVMEALSLHEASPGHHFQTALAQELEDLPAVRRFAFFFAYIEGWGLYAESLGPELGLYTDPYQRFGSLYFDIWRANRLVVDTGMHAMGWTRQEAIDWMMSNSPMTEQDVVAEVDRYIAIPGQALAYKIGQLKILELRARAEERLGENFDIRDFHDAVLTSGALPLSVLEENIDRWIDSQG